MPVAYYQDLLDQAKAKGMYNVQSFAAKQWFRNKAQQVRNINLNQLMQSDKSRLFSNITKPYFGKMIMYFYDPLWKHTLPYYDRFPVGFIVERAKGGHYLLNLHYLPPYQRAKLLDLLRRETTIGVDENQRLRITYQILQATSEYKYFRPCFKHYLTKHLRSRFFLVEPDEWDVTLFLPLAKFERGGKDNNGKYGGYISKNKIYSDSIRIARG